MDDLSYGTKEQLAFSIRLALADILSEDENQMVVLDDPLTNTDNTRLRKALDLLECYGRKVQILLITCDKSKYAGLNRKNMIEI